MALLRAFKTATIQENNIVQTIASAAGTLSSVIFVLPGLLMIGWWAHIPFLPTFGACAVGGILGVMYTIPLRRALVTNSDLPYPEGVAAAEVLKVGTGSRAGEAEGKAGLIAVTLGTLASAAVRGPGRRQDLRRRSRGLLQGRRRRHRPGRFQLAGPDGRGPPDGHHRRRRHVRRPGHRLGDPGADHDQPASDAGRDAATHALTVWKTEVRFMGAGVIGAAAIWTLGKLAGPIWSGLISSLDAGKARKVDGAVIPRTEQDIPITIVGLVTLLLLAPAGWFLADFLVGGPIASLTAPLVAIGVGYVLVAGLLAAAVCGYMAGLIGSSNSPVSGIAILTVLGASLMVGAAARGVIGPGRHQGPGRLRPLRHHLSCWPWPWSPTTTCRT
jgi:uncharacterized oligopeptide transporter (OPT) family protein